MPRTSFRVSLWVMCLKRSIVLNLNVPIPIYYLPPLAVFSLSAFYCQASGGSSACRLGPWPPLGPRVNTPLSKNLTCVHHSLCNNAHRCRYVWDYLFFFLFQTKESGKNMLKTISEKRLTATTSQQNLREDLPEAIRSVSTISATQEIPKTPIASPNATPENFSTPLFIRKTSKYKM